MSTHAASLMKSYLVSGVALFALISLPGCKRFERKHVPVDKVEELGYPTCGGKVPGPGTLISSGHIARVPPTRTSRSLDATASEALLPVPPSRSARMSPRHADVEVLYYANCPPALKRRTLPGMSVLPSRRPPPLRARTPVSGKLRA